MTSTPFVPHVGIAIDERRPGRKRCSLRDFDHRLHAFGAGHGGALLGRVDATTGAGAA